MDAGSQHRWADLAGRDRGGGRARRRSSRRESVSSTEEGRGEGRLGGGLVWAAARVLDTEHGLC